ncbi:MAG: class I SAM-dependent methyltransferase [Anaerolineae bacterium]|nr:class I SAM-dependent methyltransferase [Anaerolineae bacterium]
MQPSNDVTKAAQFWSEESARQGTRAERMFVWDVGGEIDRHVLQTITGDPNLGWLEYTLQTHFAGRVPLERCLSLGCGAGHFERDLAALGAFQSCDAYDVAPASIETARRLAAESGYNHIQYHVADINRIELPANTYDAVWIKSAMHHFAGLEHVCEQIAQALKPDGLLIIFEYVGPNRFQFPERQKEIINATLKLLPRQYRRIAPQSTRFALERSPARAGAKQFVSRVVDKLRDGDLIGVLRRRLQAYRTLASGVDMIKETERFPTVRDMLAIDPSEAVRSADILPVIDRYFEIVEKKDWGGNITLFLLSGIAGNFDEDDPRAQALLRMVIQIEQTLIAAGEFQSDSVYVVARSRQ